MSLAEWPGASTSASQPSAYRPAGPSTWRPVSRSPTYSRPARQWPNRTSQPSSSSSSRRLLTTWRKISVPMWGLWDQRTSSGAPAEISVSSTAEIRGSWVPVVSFPSEKVPAPPSPNCTLLEAFKSPVSQNRSTSRVRVSTSWPRSSTMQGSPFRARYRAANRPAGPIPTTTGGREEVRFFRGNR